MSMLREVMMPSNGAVTLEKDLSSSNRRRPASLASPAFIPAVMLA
jgi:hypothetical protein